MGIDYRNKDINYGLRKNKRSCHLNWENYGQLLGGGDFECHRGLVGACQVALEGEGNQRDKANRIEHGQDTGKGPYQACRCNMEWLQR